MYVKFDKLNQPDYGFKVRGTCIQKFINFKDQLPDQIILPTFGNIKIDNSKMKEALEVKRTKVLSQSDHNYLDNYVLIPYADGMCEIASNCFEGIKSAKIIIPANYSIILNRDSFEFNSKISLKLPKDMGLFQVHVRHDTMFDYENYSWTLIAHKNFKIDTSNSRDVYGSTPY